MPQKPQNKNDNPNAFKLWINEALLKKIASAITTAYPAFDSKSFLKTSKNLGPLEMKGRVLLVRDALQAHLPADYKTALKILVKSLDKDNLSGFDLWPYTEFIQTYGLENFEESLQALYLLTQKFTAEFAVRPFLAKDPARTYALLQKWAKDKNTHVRRLTSEGSRPRLPWGLRLHNAIKSPQEGLALLEILKFDEELYVRKSVANHLNDIAKDHPSTVVSTLTKWQKTCPPEHQAKIDWIQKHALRSLIKQGYKPALKMMGSGHKPLVRIKKFAIDKKTYSMNEPILIHLHLESTSKKQQKIIIDYIVHYMKANKETSPKVFKLKTVELQGGEAHLVTKKHSLKHVTTRKHYPGQHRLEIQINGEVVAEAKWVLKV
ncbi:hypothetical protein D3C87_340000 [compost metagenome]